jgi:hypothetical protein
VLSRPMAYDLTFRYPPPRASLKTLKRIFRFLVGD